MPKKGGKKKNKELQGAADGAPDEVQQAAESSSRGPSEVGSQAQAASSASSSQAPQRTSTQASGGFGRGRGRPREEQSQARRQEQSLQATRPEPQSQAGEWASPGQGNISRGRGLGAAAGRGESFGRGSGQGQRPGPRPGSSQQQPQHPSPQGAWRGQRPGEPMKPQQQQQPKQSQSGPQVPQQKKPAQFQQHQSAWGSSSLQPMPQMSQSQGAPQFQQPRQSAWGPTPSQSMPQTSQQKEPAQSEQPRQPAWMQPKQPVTSLPQAPQKSQGSAKQMPSAEVVTQALSEVSLQPSTSQATPSADNQEMVPTKIMKIPHRKDYNKAGTLGRKITVLTNMMQIVFGPQFKPKVIHYDINIDPDKPKYLKRSVFEAARQQLFPGKNPAFDGKKNAYSAGLLPIDDPQTIEVTVYNEEGKEKQFKITFQKAAELDLSWLKNVRPGLPQTEVSQTCIQALDIILRMAPVLKRAIPVGRSFFMPPGDSVPSLGGGMDLWVGHFQSAILGWKPFLNIDVAHKGFPKPQPVIDLMKTICGCDGQAGGGRGPPNRGPQGRQQYGRQGYDQGSTELNNDLIGRYREDIERFLKGLKVAYQIPGEPSSKRIQRVNGLVRCPRENTFDYNGRIISVDQYYRGAKNYNIKYPQFPCLWVGNREKNIHVPVELCTIVEGQVTQKKLDENQTSQMIRHAATGTEDRKKKIMEAFNKMEYNRDPCMKEFGISVNGQFTEIPARVLDPPYLAYKNEHIAVSRGQWRIDRSQFLESSLSISGDNTWVILNLEYRTQNDELYRFVDKLRETARNLGVTIGTPFKPFVKLDTRRNCMNDLETHFTSWKNKGIKLIIAVIPDKKGVYNWVKQVSELNVGILTQCLKSKTLFKIEKDRTPATITNILLKINAKLNGVNHMIAPEEIQRKQLPFCLKKPCMIVGADVTHPPPDAKDIPSIAAVVASHDPRAFQYNTEIRLQPPKQELILDFAEIMKIQLEFFNKKTGFWPLRIIYYRDGVGEGYFSRVMQHELSAIRAACKAVERKVGHAYEPPVTFLVVQKRHHTRFFPTDSRESDDKNFNVKAGTVVDTEITHSTDIDFYLVSHASIQGTARPTKYRCLWDDADMSENEIEQLTYYLCHMFSRCTRSVSYPAPTYYAHLAAFRARNLTYDVPIDVENLQREQHNKLDVKKEILKGLPMFFV